MDLDRKTLLDSINTIKPALASKDLIPELCHLWFDGEYALAYNDADLGMQIPCKTPFTGGIRGALLMGLLHNSRARDITIEPDKDEGFMVLKAAKMKARLAILPIKAMNDIWEFPDIDPKKAFSLTDEFGAMLKAVLISVGNDTSIPEKMGVTVILGEDIALYTTDSRSIAQGLIDLPPGYKKTKGEKRIILPTAFCEQMLRLCGKGGFLELREDCALAGTKDGVNIFARLIEIGKPLPFDDFMEKHLKFAKAAKFDIPERLGLALDRAMVMLEGLPGEKLEISIEKIKLHLDARIQGRGDFNDSVDVPEGVPPATFRIEPDLIKRALPLVTSMVCGEEAVYMTNGKGFRYLAATAGG